MSQNYGEVPSYDTTATGSSSGTTETAKQEAAEVKSTAQAEAGHVLDTAKQEASTVASEAKSQVKQVYAQTRQELTDQAATQQQRVADGLRSIGEELQSMARGSENQGMATDLVRQASSRLTDASSWLSQRDPGSLLDEVKTFARRKPGVFIAGALVAGVLAGRLTRALTETAKEEPAASGTTSGTTSGVPATPPTTVTTPPTSSAAVAPGSATGTVGATTAGGLETDYPTTAATSEPTPMYDSSRAAYPAGQPYSEGTGEVHDDR